ncbi:MAG: indole-3-glycerol phosphate synthase TrpC [Aurantimicrobium sp.]|nr:indole-3-glycerol phosphate synthase TrpC [Aurantimicrobium sp.]
MLSELTAGSVEDARTRERALSLAEVMERAHSAPPALDALEALAPAERVKIIAEVKRASPSRGDMAEISDPAALALAYASGGASAISVLTEERRFKGSLDDLDAVRSVVDVPILRKDFIATEYQVYEARAHRADIVLLIVAALEQKELERLYALTLSLGMTALVETHSAHEVARAVDIGAALIGVNARDLDTFELDRDLFARLADQIPGSTISVAESAVRTAADVAHYRASGADVVLVGEALVTSDPIITMAGFLAS